MNAIRSFWTTWKSSSCWSKWRASSSTVFSSSRSLLRSARSRKLPAMTVAPIAMAAIRSTPPRISQRIGPPRKADVMLNEVVPVEAIERDRCREMNFRKRSSRNSRPTLRYRAEMELTLGSLVNEALAGSGARRRQPQRKRRSAMEPAWRGAQKSAADVGGPSSIAEVANFGWRSGLPSLHGCLGSVRALFHDAVGRERCPARRRPG